MTIEVIDSHTGGEPTRLVLDGFPDVGPGSMGERVARMRASFDHLRTAIVREPRGSEHMVGALLCHDVDDADLGVIFFNNRGYLGMCGHGTIGLVASLAWAGELVPGTVRLATPAGVVRATLLDDGRVQVENVPATRLAADVSVTVDGARVVGDVAYGGNWFFLVETTREELRPAHNPNLLERTKAILRALERDGIRGADGALIDHVELWAREGDAHRNFVLCPGDEWDRSPCGTGTSAHLACLAADGLLAANTEMRQRSIIGSEFTASWAPCADRPGWVIPTITGSAFVTARAQLVLDDADPFVHGIER